MPGECVDDLRGVKLVAGARDTEQREFFGGGSFDELDPRRQADERLVGVEADPGGDVNTRLRGDPPADFADPLGAAELRGRPAPLPASASGSAPSSPDEAR